MRLIYIYHSCYVLETERCNIVFDYYKDTGDKRGKGFIHDELLCDTKPLYVLSSHVHPDHFNPDVLQWRLKRKNVRYILSKDILNNKRVGADDAVFLDKGDEYKDDILHIKAFGSTDIGISFSLETEGKRIFHAGDLNNWHWIDESTTEEVAEAEALYRKELGDVVKEVNRFDLVMFPVDPRLGTDFARGAKEWLSCIPTTNFAPMHFGGAYDKVAAFGEYAETAGSRYLFPKEKGQSFII